MKKKMMFYKFIYKFNNSPYLMATKNATIKLIPLTLVISFLTLIMNFLPLFFDKGKAYSIVNLIERITIGTTSAYSYLLVFAISFYLSLIKRKDFKINTGTFSILSLIIFNIIVNNTLNFGLGIKFIRAVIVSIISYELYYWLFEKMNFNLESKRLKQLFIEPKSILFVFFYVTIISVIASFYRELYMILNHLMNYYIYFSSSFLLSMLYSLLYVLPWIFGIHGVYLNIPYYEYIKSNQAFNQAIGEMGFHNFEILTSNFYNLFVNIGGSGATLSLLIALFLSKSKNDKSFAKIALIPSLFNINEILIFGFPIIINLYLIIPFLLVPTLFTGLSYLAIYYGLIPTVTENISWLIPPFINSLMFSKGNFTIFLWQCFLIFIGTLIYGFFLKKYNKLTDAPICEGFNFLKDIYSEETSNQTNLDILSKSTNAKIELKNLLDNGEFILFFQPIINTDKNSGLKLEALVRINHKTRGIVPPYFLEHFKTLKHLTTVDFWVIAEAFNSLKQLKEYEQDVEISINISSDTFIDTRFILKLEELIKKYKINPNQIILELVEEICIYDLNFAKERIDTLKKIGFQIAIDDFGTGYSSLSYLLDLEVDYIKIDRKFILGLEQKKGQIILSNIIKMIKSIDFKIVAEGVETIEQVNFLEKYEIDFIQGFYFSKPLSFEDTIEYIIIHKK